MINRDGREKRERREDKLTDVSTKEKNNQHIHHNIPHLLNPKEYSLSYEHPRAHMNCKRSKLGYQSNPPHQSF